MTVSVVMVSYHTGPVLYASVASVLMQDGLTECILVDNGNPPDVLSRLQQKTLSDPRLIIISGHGNVGFAAGCNLGARMASGEYLLLLNPDCILPPSAITTLVREMNVLPNTALAGVHLVNPDGSEQRGGRRSLLTPSSALMEMVGLRRINRNHMPMPTETHDVPAISGACMCVRKADYVMLGGLDEKFFLHVEDLDFCMRVMKAGKRIVCVPQVTIAHLLSTSGHAGSNRIEKLKARGFIYYFEKHFAETLWPGVMPLLRAGIWGRYYWRKKCIARKAGNIAATRKLSVLAESLTVAQTSGALTGKTVLVLGATSQVGVYVVRHLLAMGAAVLAVSRENPLPFSHKNLLWLKQDITHADFTLGGYLADVAISCAPAWHLPKILPILAASEVKRMVAIGSTSIFSKAASHNRFEKNLVAMHTRAEQEIFNMSTAQRMGWTILRPTMIYGVGLDKNITSLAHFIDRFGCTPVYPPAIGRRQPVHAEDVAIAALQAATSEAACNKSYNVSGGEILTYREMLVRIFEVMKRPPRILETTFFPLMLAIAGLVLRRPYLTRDLAYRMNEDMVFFHDDAVHDFGYCPRAFLSGGIKDLGE